MFLAAMTKKHAATVLAASTAEIVAARGVAGASAVRTAAYYAEAAGAKVAAAATVALNAALSFLTRHPVMVALIALIAVYQAVKWASERAAKAQELVIHRADMAAESAKKNRQATEQQIQTEDKQILQAEIGTYRI